MFLHTYKVKKKYELGVSFARGIFHIMCMQFVLLQFSEFSPKTGLIHSTFIHSIHSFHTLYTCLEYGIDFYEIFSSAPIHSLPQHWPSP